MKKKRAFEDIANNIKELIINGHLKPGDRLPPESEIANQFNVGRNTIREALRVLELLGFVKIKRGGRGGPVIADTSLNRITNLFLDLVKFQHLSIDEIKLARVQTEMMIFNETLKRIDGQDIEKLKKNIIKAESKLKMGHVAYEENVEFHRLLAKASKNYLYTIQAELLLTVYSDFRATVSTINPERSALATKSHKEILKQIIAGEKKKAMALFEEDLIKVGNWLGN